MNKPSIPIWIRIIASLLALGTLLFGLWIYLDSNTVFGPIAYSVPARLVIDYLAAIFVAVGVATGLAVLWQQVRPLLLVLIMQAILLAQLPVLMALNMGAWDRFYNATGLSIMAFAFIFLLATFTPTIFSVLALRKLTSVEPTT